MRSNAGLGMKSHAKAIAAGCGGQAFTSFPVRHPTPARRLAMVRPSDLSLAVILGALVLLSGCASPARPRSETTLLQRGKSDAPAPAAPAGPTLRLNVDPDDSSGYPISEFMYFVPLISPEPVMVTENTGNTQRARIRPGARRVSTETFSVTCEFEITGEGIQRNTFDSTAAIRRQERRLKEGDSMNRVLAYICVEDGGHGTVEVEGVVTNQVPTVNEVRLRFSGRGKPSPVTIGLHDIRYVDGAFRATNEMVARVSTLTFQRSTNAPRMGVTVGSVKRKEAGDGLWQRFVGNVTGAAANLLIKPIRVDPTGHEAMLKFGRALATQEQNFTFPQARNLRTRLSADSIQPASDSVPGSKYP